MAETRINFNDRPEFKSPFRPRSGRVSGQQQAAANRSNDSTLDQTEARRFVMEERRGLAARKRKMQDQIRRAYESGDMDTYDRLVLERDDPSSGFGQQVSAFRDTAESTERRLSPEQIASGRDRLREMFQRSAATAAGMASEQAAGLQGRIGAENERIGRGSIRAMGYDPNDAELGAPGGARRLGELSTPEEAARFGFDQRRSLVAQRNAALQEEQRLSTLAERGLELPPDTSPSPERLADRDLARQNAIEFQRRRLTMRENERQDFDAADTILDEGRGALVSGARAGSAQARAGETNAATDEFLASERGRVERDTSMDMRRAEVARRRAEADLAEGRADLVPAQLAVEDKELTLKKLQLDGAVKDVGGNTVVSNWDQVNEVASSGAMKIAEAFDPNIIGVARFDQVPIGAIETMNTTIVPLIEQAFKAGTASDRQAARQSAMILLGQMPPVGTSGKYEVESSLVTEFMESPSIPGGPALQALRFRKRLRATQAADMLNELRQRLERLAAQDI